MGFIVGLLTATAFAVTAPVAQAASSSLPSVASGPRPGPDLLYAPSASSPQLRNVGRWKAQPILVSEDAAYRDGDIHYLVYYLDERRRYGIHVVHPITFTNV